MGQKGFWDWEKRQEKLIEQKEFLVQLDQMIPWEEFRQEIDIIHQKPRKSQAGRKPTDVILMFKMMILQRLYNLSDAELEYQVNDRISFMRFLRLGLEDRVPDSSTLWLFREQLIKAEIVNILFEKFDTILNKHGYKAKEGQIVDASFVPVPRQHNTREENEDIKQGKLPEDWQEKPQKASQKDSDARWTKKNGQSYFGYKNHVSIDVKYGFIRRYAVSNAAVHDSQRLMQLLDIENESDEVWGDSAYRSEQEEKVLALMGFNSQIHERSYRNRPLSKEQKIMNRERSRVRAKVEHNFGSWVNEMGGKAIEVIGEVRAAAVIGLRNLAYNMKRFVYWQKQITI
jgi:IS5 family transposase